MAKTFCSLNDHKLFWWWRSFCYVSQRSIYDAFKHPARKTLWLCQDALAEAQRCALAAAQIEAQVYATALCRSAQPCMCTLLWHTLSRFGKLPLRSSSQLEQQGHKWRSVSLKDQACLFQCMLFSHALPHLFSRHSFFATRKSQYQVLPLHCTFAVWGTF